VTGWVVGGAATGLLVLWQRFQRRLWRAVGTVEHRL